MAFKHASRLFLGVAAGPPAAGKPSSFRHSPTLCGRSGPRNASAAPIASANPGLTPCADTSVIGRNVSSSIRAGASSGTRPLSASYAIAPNA